MILIAVVMFLVVSPQHVLLFMTSTFSLFTPLSRAININLGTKVDKSFGRILGTKQTDPHESTSQISIAFSEKRDKLHYDLVFEFEIVTAKSILKNPALRKVILLVPTFT